MSIQTDPKQQLLIDTATKLNNIKYGEQINPKILDFCKKNNIVIALFKPKNDQEDSLPYEIMGALDKDDKDYTKPPQGNPDEDSIWFNLLMHRWNYLTNLDCAEFSVIHNDEIIEPKSVVFYKPETN